MDAIFGAKNFRNEIVWCFRGGGVPKDSFARKHHTIFRYTKSNSFTFNKLHVPYSTASQKLVKSKGGVSIDGKERDLRRGAAMPDWWTDINSLQTWSPERTGSPDQKPLALYERIITSSSNKGDIVLDPFAGCATTIMAAHKNERRWIGIDRRIDGRFHIVCRMMGIKGEDAKALMERPDISEWVAEQMAKYEARFSTEAPIRSDTGETAAPTLEPVFPSTARSSLSHKEMHGILVERFGARCWGCDFFATGDRGARYLELDHVDPKSGGGSDHLDNRALLCGPCNKDKRDQLTLVALRRKTMGKDARNHPIDLRSAREWCRQRLNQEVSARR